MLPVWILWYFHGLLRDGMSTCVWGLLDNVSVQGREEEGGDFVNVPFQERGWGIEEVVEVSQKIMESTDLQRVETEEM